MACNLNIKAENGENSTLFKDIADTVKDPNEAVDLYFLTKTEYFKSAYKGGFDANKEPIYSEFSQDAYVNDVDYNKIEMDNSAQVYKDLLTSVPEMMSVISDRIDFLESVGDKEYIDQLVSLYEILDKEDINSSLPKFLLMSKTHMFHLRKQMVALAKEPVTVESMRKLSSLHKVAQSYSIVNELQDTLAGNEEVLEVFDAPLKNLAQISDDIREVGVIYLDKSMDHLAEQFNLRDKTWSKREIKAALRKTSRDTLWTEQMLEYMGDSRDRVLSMVATVMMEAEHSVTRQTIKFNKELQVVLEELEAKNPGKTEELFAEAILEKPSGELHVVDPLVQFTDGKDLFVDKMYNQYQKIKNNPEMAKFLTFYNDTVRKLDSGLPNNSRMGTRVPTVLRSQFELMAGKTVKEKSTLLADYAKKKLAVSNQDMEKGQLSEAGVVMRRIPTFYTKKFDSVDYEMFYKENIKEGMSEENAALNAEAKAVKKMGSLISRDLASTLQAFHAMASNYTAKNELIHIFDAAEAVVGSDRRRYTLVDSAGKIQIGVDGKEKFRVGSESNASKLLSKFYDVQLYGQKEKDLGFVDVLGLKVDVNATLRFLNTSTGFIQQAANVLAGLGNITNGEFNNVIEAIGGEYFNVKDYSKASGLYKQELFGLMKDIGQRTPSNRLNLLEEHYNILQSFGGDKMKTSERSTARRMMKTDALYFIQSSGEHFMQMRAGLAILQNIEVFNADGVSQGSLLDSHTSENGVLNVPSDLFIKDKDGSLAKFDTYQQNRISNKIGAVLRKVHGNYSSKTANAMQQDARTALVMKFRGWMYEGIKRRFGKERDYHMLETKAEGYYRTGGDALWTLVKDIKKMNLNISKENWANMTPHEKANIRRFITEMSAVLLTGIAGALLAGSKLMDDYDTDDPGDRAILGAYQMLVYQVNRLHTEIFAYLNPAEAIKLMKTPMASTSILVNMTDLLGQLMNPFEEYESGWRKGQNRLGVKIEKLTPVYKQLATLNADGIKDRGAWLIQ